MVRVLVLGQIGVILMALILADCFLMPARYRGLLVGIAAGIKLTPVLFVLYFVLRRDWRATVVATSAAAVTVVVGWVAAPGSSRSYWLGGFDKLDRFGDLAFSPVNQSVRSFVSRAAPSAPMQCWGPGSPSRQPWRSPPRSSSDAGAAGPEWR